MIYMLDTDMCSYIMREHAQSVLETLSQKAGDGETICISVITYQELRYGAARVDSQKYHKRLNAFCDRIDYVAHWDTEQADRFAVLQTQLFAGGNPIGFTDTMIAAHALTLDATLVTNNVRHFSKVAELQLENWL